MTRLVLAALLFGCGGASTPPTPAPTPAPDTEGSTVTVELHEWGLADVGAGGVVELSSGPGTPARPMPVRKPVIYAHLVGAEQATINVTARIPNGALLESWPAGERSPDGIRWANITIRSGACTTPVARDLPQRFDTADGYSEIGELPNYITDDHDCMTVSGSDAGLLFYRGSTRADALPLSAVRSADGTVQVTATRDMSGAQGSIVRITSMGAPRTISRTSFPAVNVSISIAAPTVALDPAQESATLAHELEALGMTAPEARAFLAAWENEFFGGGAQRELRWRPAPAGTDILLYWLPLDAASTIAELSTDSHVRVKRALLVRVDLLQP